MTDGSTPVDPATDRTGPGRPGRSRGMTILLLTAAAIVLLLVGATLGLALSGSFRSAPATPDSSSVEAGFARDMIVHHDQGVLMAHYAEQNTTDPEIGVMAYDIGYTQTDQIGQMQGWLSLWDLPESTGAARMSWMQDDHGGHDMAGAASASASTDAGGGTSNTPSEPAMSSVVDPATTGAPQTSADQTPLMPGMATDSEIARLRALQGTESDIYFLQLMIRHHQGGTAMMEYAAEHATNPVVRNFAQKMADSQSAEISVMTQMLQERGAEPLPAPAG
jgi:uncharacterized protein (DUF305 family)